MGTRTPDLDIELEMKISRLNYLEIRILCFLLL